MTGQEAIENHLNQCLIAQTMAHWFNICRNSATYNWRTDEKVLEWVVHTSRQGEWWAQRSRNYLFAIIGDGKLEHELENYG
jgi:hypothetical protein